MLKKEVKLENNILFQTLKLKPTWEFNVENNETLIKHYFNKRILDFGIFVTEKWLWVNFLAKKIFWASLHEILKAKESFSDKKELFTAPKVKNKSNFSLMKRYSQEINVWQRSQFDFANSMQIHDPMLIVVSHSLIKNIIWFEKFVL